MARRGEGGAGLGDERGGATGLGDISPDLGLLLGGHHLGARRVQLLLPAGGQGGEPIRGGRRRQLSRPALAGRDLRRSHEAPILGHLLLPIAEHELGLVPLGGHGRRVGGVGGVAQRRQQPVPVGRPPHRGPPLILGPLLTQAAAEGDDAGGRHSDGEVVGPGALQAGRLGVKARPALRSDHGQAGHARDQAGDDGHGGKSDGALGGHQLWGSNVLSAFDVTPPALRGRRDRAVAAGGAGLPPRLVITRCPRSGPWGRRRLPPGHGRQRRFPSGGRRCRSASSWLRGRQRRPRSGPDPPASPPP